MGLAQKIEFKYSSRNELENFVLEFCHSCQCEQKDNLFILTSSKGNDFRIELAIEDNGLYIHRSGNYFEVLGILIEELTGVFGKISVDDI